VKGRSIGIAAIGAVGVIGLACAGVGVALAGSDPDPDPRPQAAARAAPITGEEPTGSADPTPTGSATATPTAPAASVDPAWLAASAQRTGIPERAMSAYASAALTAADAFPSCGLGWNTLAAIGFVESEHGSLGGATLGADGVARPRILGPALDGTRFDAIPDTDGGRLDGDRDWDRAIGPMQFLPETWAAYGRDGDGDGLADPDQLDDAALSAATMLCTAGGDLTVPENWIAAVDAYNPSIAYNNDVADAAEHYAQSAG